MVPVTGCTASTMRFWSIWPVLLRRLVSAAEAFGRMWPASHRHQKILGVHRAARQSRTCPSLSVNSLTPDVYESQVSDNRPRSGRGDSGFGSGDCSPIVGGRTMLLCSVAFIICTGCTRCGANGAAVTFRFHLIRRAQDHQTTRTRDFQNLQAEQYNTHTRLQGDPEAA